MEQRKIVRREQRTKKLSHEQQAQYEEIRTRAARDYPPSKDPKLKPATSGIGFQVRCAREAKGLTWYAVAKAAGIPNQNTVRDIEYGRDVNLSNLEAVAAVLGLRLALVEV
jgi:hypothetical protein